MGEIRPRVSDLPFAVIVEHMGEAAEIIDADGRWLYVNPAFERTMGYRAEDCLGRTPAETFPNGSPATHFADEIWSAVRAGEPWRGVVTSQHKSGAWIVQHTRVVPVLDEAGEMLNLVVVKRDVTEQERTNEEHRALTAAAGDAIIVCDFDTAKVLNVNPAAIGLFGYDVEEFRALTGRRLSPKSARADVDLLIEDVVTCDQARRRLKMVTKAGKEFVADVRLSAFSVAGQRLCVAIMRDVSEVVQREEELARSYAALKDARARAAHSEKLAALGMVSAGIAHEISNPAGFVAVNLALIGERLADEHPSPEALAECHSMLADCLEGVDRIRTITSDLRTFARIELEDMRPVDINEAIRVACRIVANEIRHRAQLVQRLGDVPLTMGDRARLVSMFTNLLVNAAHAITSGDAARNLIEVETAAESEGIRIVVADTGCGIPEEIQYRVFEPFMTTQPVGAGTGLGLPLCANIVRNHGGRIDVDSEVGVGTRVTVWLPTAPATARLGDAPKGGLPVPEPPPRPQHRILIIDDDHLVLSAFARALQRTGEVVTAASGEEALAILARDSAFDVLMCDLMLPTMDGPEIYEQVCRAAPHLARRFLFCSGGAFTPRVRQFTAEFDIPVLDKPIGAAALREAVLRACAR